ncbi:response regulator [Candidatus Sumerlaeota bacterium]|nr:response regulator [Candidatus Sumerlaeota bacterium]
MAKKKILIVEDDTDIRELLRYNLVKAGYDVLSAATGEEGLRAARDERPDLVVLDLMLPQIDGLAVCRLLKGEPATEDIPIVMLTAKGEESDIVRGLETGADDYVTKPFSPRILLARIKSVLRRRSGASSVDEAAAIRVHGLAIDPGRHEVVAHGKSVDLTATEFRILHFLARKPGWVFTRYQIVNGIRGEGYPVTDRSVDVQIVGLRKKLGPAAECVQTVRGVGYRFREDDGDA